MQRNKQPSICIGALLLIPTLVAITGSVFGQNSSTPPGSATSQASPARELAAVSTYTRAVLIERYDEDGNWRKIPRKAVLTGDAADRLGKSLPELGVKLQIGLTVTQQPMRFEITFTSADGREVVAFINPTLTEWWNEYAVYKLSRQAGDVLDELAKTEHEDESLVLKFAPVVKAEIVDRETGFLRLRRIPTKITYTGLQAELLARAFPEIGLKRVPQLADAGGYRFEVTLTRDNGEVVKIYVSQEPGKKWTWYEGHSYWELSSDTAGLLLVLTRNAPEDPSLAVPQPGPVKGDPHLIN